MANAVVTQVVAEVLYLQYPNARVSQVAIEILMPNKTFVPQIYRRV